jgi:heme/copper-type cytochrome/quinol oxidase subunit 1
MLCIIFSFWTGILCPSITIIIWLELETSEPFIINDQVFYSIITSHVFVIIIFTVIPFLIGGFGNFLVPLMLVTPTLRIVYQRISKIRFWLLSSSLTLLIIGSYIGTGTGWTVYPSLNVNTYHNDPSIGLTTFSLHISGTIKFISRILTP